MFNCVIGYGWGNVFIDEVDVEKILVMIDILFCVYLVVKVIMVIVVYMFVECGYFVFDDCVCEYLFFYISYGKYCIMIWYVLIYSVGVLFFIGF